MVLGFVLPAAFIHRGALLSVSLSDCGGLNLFKALEFVYCVIVLLRSHSTVDLYSDYTRFDSPSGLFKWVGQVPAATQLVLLAATNAY